MKARLLTLLPFTLQETLDFVRESRCDKRGPSFFLPGHDNASHVKRLILLMPTPYFNKLFQTSSKPREAQIYPDSVWADTATYLSSLCWPGRAPFALSQARMHDTRRIARVQHLTPLLTLRMLLLGHEGENSLSIIIGLLLTWGSRVFPIVCQFVHTPQVTNGITVRKKERLALLGQCRNLKKASQTIGSTISWGWGWFPHGG